jgi:hypothetical protein
MKTYKLFQIYVDTDIRVFCTDNTVLQWTIDELQNQYPNSKITKLMNYKDGFYCIEISKVGREGYKVGWWIMEQLGKKGWEPIGAALGNLVWSGIYYFRFEEILDG